MVAVFASAGIAGAVLLTAAVLVACGVCSRHSEVAPAAGPGPFSPSSPAPSAADAHRALLAKALTGTDTRGLRASPGQGPAAAPAPHRHAAALPTLQQQAAAAAAAAEREGRPFPAAAPHSPGAELAHLSREVVQLRGELDDARRRPQQQLTLPARARDAAAADGSDSHGRARVALPRKTVLSAAGLSAAGGGSAAKPLHSWGDTDSVSSLADDAATAKAEREAASAASKMLGGSVF